MKHRIGMPSETLIHSGCNGRRVAKGLSLLAIAVAGVLPAVSAKADQTKADNTTVLDAGGSWVRGVAPTSTDLAIWSGTYNTSGSLSAAFTAGTPVSWEGIQIGNITGTAAGLISIGGTGAAVTGSSVTLGTGGIDMSAANENLVINTLNTVIAANQTWNISSGHNLRFGKSGTGSANAVLTGTGNVTVAGNGLVDLNEGGASGFTDANSFAGFSGTWTVNAGATLRALRNGADAFGSSTAANAITLDGGTLAVGGISGAVGNWSWDTNITLGSGFTSSIDEQNYNGAGRYLKLNGNITGSATANLVFKDTDATSTFTNPNLGYILTGSNSMSPGSTLTIGGPVENGIAGRLTDLRVGGVTDTNATTGTVSTSAGPGGSLGAATVVDNGNLTFAYSGTATISNNISGTGNVNVGGTASAANAAISGAGGQVLTLTGSTTYTGLTSVAGGSTLVLATPGTFSNAFTGGFTLGFSGTNGTTGTLNLSSGTNVSGVGPITVNSGTVNVNGNLGSTGTMLLGSGTSGVGTLNINSGIVSLKGISLTATTTSGGVLNLNGGVLNIGSAGIAAAAAGFSVLNLGPATVGASANWSSNQSFSLTDSSVGTTFNTTDSVDGTTPRTITLSGSLSGGGLLNVTGAGKLYLNGSVSGGAVNVGGGATLGGTGTIAAPTTVAGGGFIEAGQLGAGTLTFNNGLTFNGSAGVNIGGLASYISNPAINDTGTLVANGAANSVTINVANLVGTSTGDTYRLLTYSGGSIGGTSFPAFQLAPLPSRATGTLTDTGSEIDLTITGTDFLVWTGASNLANGWDTTTPNWKLNSNGTPTTYIDSPSPDAVVFDDSAPPTNTTVNLNTVVHPNAVTFNNSTNTYTITGSGSIAGPTGLMMNGTGTVNLNTSNSFTGPVAINAGITSVQNGSGLGGSVGVTVAPGATLQLQSGITTGNVPLTISGTGASGQNGVLVNSGGTNTYSGAITLAADSTISSDTGNLTLSSTTPISGSGYNLTLAGAGNGTVSSPIGTGGGMVTINSTGTWTFSGANTYTGSTNISSGTLSVSSSSALASSAAINLGPSSSGSGTIALNISGGVTVSSPITVSSSGTETITLNVTGSTTSTVSGAALNLNSNLIVNNENTAVLPSSFTANYLPSGGLNISSGITGSGGVTFTGGGVTLLKTGTNTYSGQTLVTGNSLLEYYGSGQTDPNSVLNISSGSLAVGGELSAGQFGGLVGAGQFVGAVGATGNGTNTIGFLNDPSDNFSGVASGMLQIVKTGSGMQILSGPNTYTGSTTVNGGTLQAGVATVAGVSGAFGLNNPLILGNNSGATADLNGFNTSVASLAGGGTAGGNVTLGSATLTISGTSNASFGGMISGTGALVLSTTGSQTLTGSDTYTGGTNVSAGKLYLTATGALPINQSLVVASNASTIATNHGTNPVTVLQVSTLTNSGTVDLTNNDLVIRSATSLGAVTAQVAAAFNGGLWNGNSASGVITSSTAQSDTSFLTAVGIATGAEVAGGSVDGVTVNSADVVVKYTYYGDANLDGAVDGSDYTMIDAGFNSHGTLTGWAYGDFNYDNVIDGSDYTLIDNAFNTQGVSLGTNPAALIASSTAQIAGPGAAVPEPATIGMFALGLTGLATRRRRKPCTV